MRKNRRKRRGKRKVSILSLIIIIVFTMVLSTILIITNYLKKKAYDERDRLKTSVIVELGEPFVEVKEFLLEAEELASYVEVPTKQDLEKPGVYPVEIKIDNKVYESTVYVVDTTPPKAIAKDLTMLLNVDENFSAEDFIEAVEDFSDVEISFKNQPNFNKPGTHEVLLIVKDEFNNTTELSTNLTIIADTTPPLIEGTKNHFVFVGETVSYRKDVVVTDDIDDNVELIIDNSEVNLKKPGEYKLIYTATDSSGNISSNEVKVTVREKTPKVVSETDVFEIADGIIKKITKESMSHYDRAYEIYKWVKNNVSYTGHSEKADYINGAYTGFKEKRGDCFTYFSVTKVLLDRAGIPNLDVRRVGGRTNHYWHLVDYGQGWYHFDTTPQADYLKVFMLTDAEVAEYTARGDRNYYTYDKSLYPEVVQ